MEDVKDDQQVVTQHHYDTAANLLINESRTASEAKRVLITQGLNEAKASEVITKVEEQIAEEKREGASKDMLYGALWCIGGVVATVADFGYVFWGAIVFGGVQFFKGLINSRN
ncbi:MAG: hypothetical protein RLZZ262_538 [Bacteroidota bacterium]|jgi:histone deacetylase complex regulatory component SIN3